MVVVSAANVQADVNVVVEWVKRREWNPMELCQEIPQAKFISLLDASCELLVLLHHVPVGPPHPRFRQRVVVLNALRWHIDSFFDFFVGAVVPMRPPPPFWQHGQE